MVDLAEDDRATLLGALLDIAGQLRNGSDDDASPADLRARWRRRGMRAFDADRDALAAGLGIKQGGQPGKGSGALR